MYDIKWIRENPADFDDGLKRRGAEPQSDVLLKLDAEVRRLQTDMQEKQTESNAIAKDIPAAIKRGEDIAPIKEKGKQLKEEVARLNDEVSVKQEALKEALAGLPNRPADDVPQGADESENVEIRRHGEPVKLANPKLHDELGEALGLMDFERAAKLSGARFVVLSGELARMERALASFFLDHNTQEYGYREVAAPFMVRAQALYGTGQLPKFEEDLFKTDTEHYLIPTAEVPLTNLVMDEIVDEATLPLRMTAYTPCFRSEAGAAGRDTRGMIRQHQFSKVEMVSITTPEQSEAEHERMTECAESLLKKLGLAYRTMVLCTGDMGFSAQKTYDIEVWMPGQDAYREISSCSNCGDFQARRMKARTRPAGEKTTRFVHTLNGSGLPIGRTMVAIIENYQQPDGSIVVPDALQPYMGGIKVIGGKA